MLNFVAVNHQSNVMPKGSGDRSLSQDLACSNTSGTRRSRTSFKTSLCDICLLPDGKSCSPSHQNAFCATNVVLSRISLEELSTLIEEPLTEKEEEGLLDIEETPVKTHFSDEEIWHGHPSAHRCTLGHMDGERHRANAHLLWHVHPAASMISCVSLCHLA